MDIEMHNMFYAFCLKQSICFGFGPPMHSILLLAVSLVVFMWIMKFASRTLYTRVNLNEVYSLTIFGATNIINLCSWDLWSRVRCPNRSRAHISRISYMLPASPITETHNFHFYDCRHEKSSDDTKVCCKNYECTSLNFIYLDVTHRH